MRHLIKEEGREKDFYVDSAGLSDFHQGAPMDTRSASVAEKYGYDTRHRARAVTPQDFFTHHVMFAMTQEQLTILHATRDAIGTTATPPKGAAPCAPIRLFLEALSPDKRPQDVPDPYNGGMDGFERVFSLIHACCLCHWEALKQR